MRVIVEHRSGTLLPDEETRSHIRQAAEWLTDPQGRSGLLMSGMCGNGKTTLMRAVTDLVAFHTEAERGYSDRKAFVCKTAKEVAMMCCGTDRDFAEYRKLIDEPLLAIDDLGEEPAEVIRFGQTFSPVTDLLLARYDKPWRVTLATTNLRHADIESHYGGRILDRFREMMTEIAFTNPSYRGKNRPQAAMPTKP